jgi:hypothetical protein
VIVEVRIDLCFTQELLGFFHFAAICVCGNADESLGICLERGHPPNEPYEADANAEKEAYP